MRNLKISASLAATAFLVAGCAGSAVNDPDRVDAPSWMPTPVPQLPRPSMPVAGAVDNAPLDAITQHNLSEMRGPQWSDAPGPGAIFAGHVPGGPDLFVTQPLPGSVPYNGVPTVMPAVPCCP
jgi:hypothetical protein